MRGVAWRSRGIALLAVTLGALALMTPAVLVGHPNVFPDTSAYELIGQWLFERMGLDPRGGFSVMRHRADLGLFFTMAGARSPTYSLALFAITNPGSAWAMAGLQSLIGSALIALALRVTLGRFRIGPFAALIAGMTLFTSLPWFAILMMPDVFMGYAALAAVLLIVDFDRLTRLEQVMLALGLALALSFHASNPPILMAIVVVAALAIAVRALPAGRAAPGLAICLLAAGAAVLTLLAYPRLVEALAHRPLSRPPFLTARLLADGPGRDYLAKACAEGEPLALCPYQGRPMTDANAILWSPSKTEGVYEPAPYSVRLAMTRQEPAFVRGVIFLEPWRTLSNLARDAWEELIDVNVIDTLGYRDYALIARGPGFAPPFPAMRVCVRRPNLCYPTPFQLASQGALQAGLILGAGYLILRLLAGWAWIGRRLPLAPLAGREAVATLAVLAVTVGNAVFCGAISGVFPRYQMRMDWIVPLWAGLCVFAAVPTGDRLAAVRAWAASRANFKLSKS
ncbi:MAG: hypothetical protein KGL69_10055 [Alphaproteobacteria bacterium]|nr:hypothetical protein [Alphaproteobacteria bacterium]